MLLYLLTLLFDLPGGYGHGGYGGYGHGGYGGYGHGHYGKRSAEAEPGYGYGNTNTILFYIAIDGLITI